MSDDLNADPLTGLEETPEEVAAANTLVSRLSVVVFLEWLGAGAVLPLLPIYLRQHGATTGFVGLTMSAFFLAGLVSQFPAGRVADRTGKRPVPPRAGRSAGLTGAGRCEDGGPHVRNAALRRAPQSFEAVEIPPLIPTRY